jgi:hypothetical protein
MDHHTTTTQCMPTLQQSMLHTHTSQQQQHPQQPVPAQPQLQ